ncbi:MAG: NYN domain-containing protein [Chloroflexi bacterium]|nr:NYN domain-containing protein [Chloroflexota bacterium]
MTRKKVVVLYDYEYEYRHARRENSALNLSSRIQELARLSDIYGGERDITVFISEYDEDGVRSIRQLPIQQVISMNGNRPEMVSKVTGEMARKLHNEPPWLVLVVSRDASLANLLKTAAAVSAVIVFVPGDQIPLEFAEASEWARANDLSLECHALSEMAFYEQNPQVYVKVDLENILLCLRDKGFGVIQPDKLHALICEIASRYGQVVSIVYAADWSKLPGDGLQMMATLADLGAQTRHVASRNNKNSVDMVLNNEINDILQKLRGDVLLCCTNDKDFRDIYRRAKSEGIKVVNIGVRGKMSRDLQQAADDVVYLDDGLAKLQPVKKIPVKETDAHHPMAGILMRVATELRRRDYAWFYREDLFALFENDPGGKAQLEEAIRQNYLVPGIYPGDTWMLNRSMALAQAARRIVARLSQRIRWALDEAHMPYVSSGYLINEMSKDSVLVELGIGGNKYAAGKWLDLAAEVGLIEKIQQPDPKRPYNMINVCRLK